MQALQPGAEDLEHLPFCASGSKMEGPQFNVPGSPRLGPGEALELSWFDLVACPSCWELGCHIVQRGCLCFSLPICPGEGACTPYLAHSPLSKHLRVRLGKAGSAGVGHSDLGWSKSLEAPLPLSPAWEIWWRQGSGMLSLGHWGGSHQLGLSLEQSKRVWSGGLSSVVRGL
jgi:hypothetical protein